jgi:hypothetical protein
VTPEQAREVLAAWMQPDGATLDDERAALVRMVERVEFDPATGRGRILYKIEAPVAFSSQPGNAGRPHGDSLLTPVPPYP